MTQEQLNNLENIVAQPKLVQSIHSKGEPSVVTHLLNGQQSYEADMTKPASLLQSPPKPH